MLIDKILLESKHEIVNCVFDMDGTCVEYGAGEKPLILNNTPHFYFNKRPIRSVLKVMKKLSKTCNIYILSNCYFNEQKADKIAWLEKFAPFIPPENINIIVYANEKFDKAEKDFLKAKKLKLLFPSTQKTYFFEDDHFIIKATSKMLPYISCQHISSLIK